MISGHWITGTGQVVVPTRFLERTGTGKRYEDPYNRSRASGVLEAYF
ncbi:hypothetical protein SALBM135S_05034 [Streptomyces alboniger]